MAARANAGVRQGLSHASVTLHVLRPPNGEMNEAPGAASLGTSCGPYCEGFPKDDVQCTDDVATYSYSVRVRCFPRRCCTTEWKATESAWWAPPVVKQTARRAVRCYPCCACIIDGVTLVLQGTLS